MGYFDLFCQKFYLFSNSRLAGRHNDVIMGNMKGLVTLLFFKIKSTNLASWGILMQIFEKLYNSKSNASMASV